MSTLQFISDLIGSLVWPFMAIILVVILRKEIRELLVSVTRVRFKDLEMDFQRLAESARKLPRSAPSAVDTDKVIYTSIEDQMLYVAEQAPSAAILMAWASVETAMSSAVARLAISPDSPQYRSTVHNLEQLERYAELPEGVIRTVQELRMLRNKVAHDEKQRLQISQDDALTYAKTAIRIVNYLSRLTRQSSIR